VTFTSWLSGPSRPMCLPGTEPEGCGEKMFAKLLLPLDYSGRVWDYSRIKLLDLDVGLVAGLYEI